MNRITRHLNVSTFLMMVAMGTVIGYTTLGQRAVAPDAAVIAVVRIDTLFDQLEQRADAMIELRKMELDFQDENRSRAGAITDLQTELENVVAATRRKELADEIALKQLQLRLWQQAALTELEVEKAVQLQSLYRSMRAAIEALATAEGYDLVLLDDSSDDLPFDRESRIPPQRQVLQQIATRKILYRNSALEITMDLATRMNNKYRGP
ncbi:MAG: OmpH family outer membrane protein [Myxococcota bacterium]